MATLQSATQRFSDWFQGSALEPTALQALPAESTSAVISWLLQMNARQSLGSSAFPGRA